MRNKVVKYSLIAILAIVLILAWANPSLKQFKEYIGEEDKNGFVLTFKRTHNYLFFSTYEFSFYKNEADESFSDDGTRRTQLFMMSGTYTGFFLNFYKE